MDSSNVIYWSHLENAYGQNSQFDEANKWFEKVEAIENGIHKIILESKNQNISSSAESVGKFYDYSPEKVGESVLYTSLVKSFNQNESAQNSAATLFSQENALNFKNWYHPEICTYLMQMVNNKAKCVSVLFPDSGYDDNTDTFTKQLHQLVMLSNIQKRAALFISKEPGADNHFICGLVKKNNLLLINPLGRTSHDICYQTLAKLQKENIIKNIWLSSNHLQKKEYEEGLVSCGPITLELTIHILTTFTPEELELFWVDNLKTGESTTHNASQLVYHGVNIKNLLHNILKKLGKSTHKHVYQNKICDIRKKHYELLQTLPVECANNLNVSIENYLASCKDGSSAQVVFNGLIMDKNINTIEELPEYEALTNELKTQIEKSENLLHVKSTPDRSNQNCLQELKRNEKSNEAKIDQIDTTILWQSQNNLNIDDALGNLDSDFCANNHGNIHYKHGQFKGAVKNYTKATQLKPDNALYWNNLGNAYYKDMQYKMAIESYNKAIKLQPNNLPYVKNFENAHYKDKQYNESKEDVNKMEELQLDGVSDGNASANFNFKAESVYCELDVPDQNNNGIENMVNSTQLQLDNALYWNSLGKASYEDKQ